MILKRIKKTQQLLSLTICFLVSFASLTTATALEIKIHGQEGSLVKYNNSSKERPGICNEIINAIQIANPQIHFVGQDNLFPLKRIENQLENGEIDVAICLLKSPDRIIKFDYLETPLYPINHVLVALQETDNKITNYSMLLEESKKNPIVVTQGSSLIKVLNEQGIITDSTGKDEAVNFLKLINKRNSYFYGQDLTIFEALRSSSAEIKSKLQILPTHFKSDYQYIAVSKKADSKIKTSLTETLLNLKKSGKLDEIIAKYSKP